MDIIELEKLMKEKGLVIRAIPHEVKNIYDSCHINDFPNAKLEYISQFGREMCVVMQSPKHAGKFMVESAMHTYMDVRFRHAEYFDTIQDAINYIIGG
jgi:hypothetical protein